MARSPQLSQEHGFALIETLVSAALLAVMVLALLTTFDVTSRVSGQGKSRAVAASLAQQDQERMRALPVAVLSKTANQGPQSAESRIDDVPYTVRSQADWIADDSQSTSCTSNGAAADYLKITSTVSAPATTGIRPVTVTSVVTPPTGSFNAGQGSLAVKVVNAAGGPQPNVSVALSGTGAGATRITDNAGCAFFGYQAVGSYTATLSAVGMVDTTGNPTPAKAENIASEAMSTDSFQYDVAGTVTTKFVTHKLDAAGNLPTGTAVADFADSSSRKVSFAHGNLSVPRTFGDASTAAATIEATRLFPFTDPYAIYAGDCTGARPAAAAAVGARPAAPVNRLGSAGGTVPVLVPAISFTVTTSGTDATKNQLKDAIIRLRPTGTGCSGTFNLGGPGARTQANGRVVDPGAPFGTYAWCVQGDLGDGQGNRVVKSTTDLANTAPGGVKTVVSLASAPTGTCP